MDIVSLTGPVNFRDLLDALEDGLFADIGDGSGRKFLDIPSLGLYATATVSPYGQTIFTIRDESGETAGSISVDQALDLSSPGIGLKEALFTEGAATSFGVDKLYSLQDADAQLTTFATDDTVIVQAGKLNAAAGDDRIAVIQSRVEENAVLGSGDRAIIKGGDGNDSVLIEHLNANINTGDDDDTISMAWGKVIARGGAGNDTFIFDSSSGDILGSAAEKVTALEVEIKDFKSGIDSFVFQTTTNKRGNLPEDRFLSDLFEGSTLADLGETIDVDGVLWSFAENARGYAVIERSGSVANGRGSVDETITIKAHGLADIALDDITVSIESLSYGFLL